MTVDSYEVVSDSQLTRFCVEGFKTSTLAGFLDSKGTQHLGGGGEGGTPLQEADRDVPLDGVACSRLECS